MIVFESTKRVPRGPSENKLRDGKYLNMESSSLRKNSSAALGKRLYFSPYLHMYK